MLTILHPEILPAIKQMPVGLLPHFFEGEDLPVLVVKAPKESILAAKINLGFSIYLAPAFIEGQQTCTAITAFFDDYDEPLTITSPLFKDVAPIDLIKILKKREIRVHFFDELSRELLVYQSTVLIPDEINSKMVELLLPSFSFPKARAMLDGAIKWFGLRNQEDDARAIKVVLGKSEYSEGLFIQDLQSGKHAFHGSKGFSSSTLEREEPGSCQEEDIIQCLLSVFPSKQIFLSPKRTIDKEEVCDVLVLTKTRTLIIQAKDSPNIERVSRQNISRKRKNILSALRKATGQVKGAIGYFRRNKGELEILIGDERHLLKTENLQLHALVIVKELFNDQFGEYSNLLLKLVNEENVPCIALDYPELHQYCAHLRNEESFFEAYDRVMNTALSSGKYPRLRLGVVK